MLKRRRNPVTEYLVTNNLTIEGSKEILKEISEAVECADNVFSFERIIPSSNSIRLNLDIACGPSCTFKKYPTPCPVP